MMSFFWTSEKKEQDKAFLCFVFISEKSLSSHLHIDLKRKDSLTLRSTVSLCLLSLGPTCFSALRVNYFNYSFQLRGKKIYVKIHSNFLKQYLELLEGHIVGIH